MKPKILIIDDDTGVHGSFLLAFRNSEIEQKADLEFFAAVDEALAKFEKNPFSYALAFIDYNFGHGSEKQALGHLVAQKLKAKNPSLTTVIISGDESKEALSNWLKSGVDKFLYKPVSMDAIRGLSENALEFYEQQIAQLPTAPMKSKEQQLVGLAGKSDNIRQVCKLALRYAKSPEPVLILGETGTGKELVAKAIHEQSERSKRSFVAVNCASLSQTLFESELFGHVKGAFTDAKEDKLGKFRQADKGTIFLDEIHHLTLPQQASLLRVLQEKQVLPVGGKFPISVDFKLVVAGKPNLRDLSEKGEFLPDLYFRIKFLDITILPLRERPEDILPLVGHIQNEVEKETGDSKMILRSALDKLVSYQWPGNVRELYSEIKRIYLVNDKSQICENDLSSFILEQSSFSYYKPGGDNLLTMGELSDMQKNQEIALIIKALKKADNNVSKTARILDISRTTLISKLEVLGLRGKTPNILDLILTSITKKKNEGGIKNEKENSVERHYAASL